MKYLFIYFMVCCFCLSGAENAVEAERFYDEYITYIKSFGYTSSDLLEGFLEQEKNLDAAIALDPDNPKYLYAKICYDICKVIDKTLSNKERMNIIRKYIEDGNKFIDKYPDYKYPEGISAKAFTFFPNQPVSPLSHLRSYFQKTEDQAALSEILPEIWKMHDRSKFGNAAWYFPDATKISTVKELSKYSRTIDARIGAESENNALRLLQRSYEAEIEILNAATEFAKKYPAEKDSIKKYRMIYFVFISLPHYKQDEAWQELQRILNENFAELSKLYTNSPFKDSFEYLNELTATREFLNSDASIESYKKALDGAFERSIKKYGPIKIDENFIKYSLLLKVGKWKKISSFQCEKIIKESAEECLQRLYPERETKYSWSFLTSSPTPETIIKNAEMLRKQELRKICNNSFGNTIWLLGNNMYIARQQKENAQTAIDMLNNNFEIKEITAKHNYYYNAVEYNDKIYIISGKGQIIEFAKNNYQTKIIFENLQSDFYKNTDNSISASGNLLILGGDSKALIIDLQNKTNLIIEDLPAGNIASAAVIDERIYYLCAGDLKRINARKALSMYSTDLSGKDRKIHFSTARADKQSEIEHLTSGKVSNLITLPNGKLLFSINDFDKVGRIYTFDPKTEKIELLNDQEKEFIVTLYDMGDFILGRGGRMFGEAFFTMDKKTLERDWFFTQNIKDKSRNWKYKIDGYYAFCDTVILLPDKYLVSAGRSLGNMFLNLQTPEKSPFLLLPTCIGVFYNKEKKEFIYPTENGRSIFIVRVKQ